MTRQRPGVRPPRQTHPARPLTLTRRRVVSGALGVAGVSATSIGLIGSGGGLAKLVSLLAAQGSEKLRELASEESLNGLLRVTLVAGNDATRGPGAVAYGSGSEICEVGDGEDTGFGRMVPGPTLRVVPGDRIKLKLTNCLSEATNLHFHGLHVSPIANSDNVLLHLTQGESYEFEINIPPDHPTGLFWYHPHLHGESSDQVERGLAGAIIIDQNPDEDAAYTSSLLESGARYPGPPGAKPRLLVFQHLNDEPEDQEILINGQIKPIIEIHRLEEQRWQLLNATANHFVNVHIEGHELTRLAVDGNWIPNYQVLPKVKVLALGPAERAEVLITGIPDEAITEPRVIALSKGQLNPVFDRDFPDDAEELAEFLNNGEVIATLSLLPGSGATGAPPPPFVPAVTCDHPTGNEDRTIAFTPRLKVDHKHFSSGRIDQTVALGAVEIWQIINQHLPGLGWHPFHLHVNDFDVLETSDEGLGPRYYQDTIPLPPQTTDASGNPKDGSVRFCSRFVDYTGRFVYHCHFLLHEDQGMMAAVEVVAHVPFDGSGYPETIDVVVGPKAVAEVNAGATVVWTNTDTAEHTITAEELDEYNDRPLFDSGSLAHNCSFAHTFDAPGTIPYRCANHPNERGIVVVTSTQTIDIRAGKSGLEFVPAHIDVALGTVMSWTNRDSSPHTITVVKRTETTTEPAADSPTLATRAEFRHTFEEGDYEYWSTSQPGTKGRFTVAPVTRRSVSIGIHNTGLDQPRVKVPAGSTVTWTNRSAAPQTISENLPTDSEEEPFESGPLNADTSYGDGRLVNFGQRFSHRFDTSVVYFSKLAMTGEILVSEDASEGEVQIEIANGAFVPATVVVRPNATVTWKNASSITHSVTSDGIFDKELAPGAEFATSFPAADDDPISYYSKWALRGEIEVVSP